MTRSAAAAHNHPSVAEGIHRRPAREHRHSLRRQREAAPRVRDGPIKHTDTEPASKSLFIGIIIYGYY